MYNNSSEILKYLKKSSSLPLWEDMYKYFMNNYCIIEAAECVLSAIKLENAENGFFNDKSSVLFAATNYYLQKKDGENALKFINLFNDDFLFILYYKAMAKYYSQKYGEAKDYFEQYLLKCINHDDVYINEEVYFYLGNCYYKENKHSKAIEFYYKALERKKSFFEVIANIAIIFKNNDDIDTFNKLSESLPEKHKSNDVIMEIIVEKYNEKDFNQNIKNIPIFINSRDRLNVLKELINWLLKNQYSNIYILDNDSSYIELKNYYEFLEKEKGITVFYLRQNMGHTALWKSGILEKLNIKTPYVYTDPDVVPIDECPDNVIMHFINILNNNTMIKKVGFGIKFDDISFFDKDKIIELEKSHLDCPIAEEQYFASVDTTFAVYRNIRYYTFREAIRTGYPYIIRHLPYYFDYNNLLEDEKYYIKNANKSSSIAENIKKL